MSILVGSELWSAAKEIEAISVLARDNCLPALNNLAEEAKVYTCKDRLKGAQGIYQKVIRKRQEATPGSFGSQYNPEHVTDGWGCRFVTLFQDDIIKVSRGILDLICHRVPSIQSPFKKFGLKEICIYTSRPIGDVYSVSSLFSKDLEQYRSSFPSINWDEIVKPPENKKSAYSSVHFIVRVPVIISGYDNKKRDPGKIESTALIEIQVRDIFEESWGEIQHRLIYSGKDNIQNQNTPISEDSLEALKILEIQKQREIFWGPNIYSLKLIVDACSQLANNIIKSGPQTAKASTGNETQPISLAEDDKTAILNSLPKTASADVRDKIAQAYDAIIEARELGEEAEVIQRCRTVVELLQSAIDVSEKYHKTMVGQRTLRYHLIMEKAYALSLLQSVEMKQERQQEIFRLYDEAIAANPQDVTALYRRGWATHRAANHDGREYTEAMVFLDRATAALPFDKTFLRPHWLEIALPLSKGFLYWAQARLAKPRPSSEKALNLLGQAAACNEEAKALAFSDRFSNLLGVDDWRHKILSNEIYYLLDRCSPGATDIPADNAPPLSPAEAEAIRQGLESLQASPMAEYAERNFQTRDTILCAYRILGDVENVMTYANKNLTELSEKAALRLGRPLDFVNGEEELKVVLQPNELKCYFTARDALSWRRKLLDQAQ
jgi:ppGpp synthetase/RelA/SpoT-type nucleotidyltranferase